MTRIALVAGEVSGDRLGAGLIRAAAARDPELRCGGIAGPAMAAAGCEVWVPSEALAVMGLVEVLRHLPRIRAAMGTLESRLEADPPDVLVGIDAPDFNLRVEKRARRAGIPTVHYVSPSVWAWRQGRVRTLREACDSVLCLLPFEAEFLGRHGVHATFVGHPLADELPAEPDRAAARHQLGLPDTGGLVALLPGSRAGEVERLGPVFAEAAAWLSRRDPSLRFVAPVATPALGRQFAAHLERLAPESAVTLVEGQSHAAMAASDVVLLASGTATLEAMLLRRPMVVAYRLAPVTWGLVRGLGLVKVKHVSLPNLLAGEALVPELLQGAATGPALGAQVAAWLDQPARVAALDARFAALGATLRRGASERAAEEVLRVARSGRRVPAAGNGRSGSV
jgi:lipid-A-disaccharide synthase